MICQARLSASGVRTPAGSRLFLILVSKSRFKGAAMQIQLDHIGGGEGPLRQVRQEELVDDAGPLNANPALLSASRMGRYHDSAAHALWSHRHIGAVIEGAHDLADLGRRWC